MLSEYGYGVPDTGLNIDSDCIAAEDDGGGDLPGVVEGEERQLARKHQKRLGLGRIAVPVRRDVRAPRAITFRNRCGLPSILGWEL